MGAILDGFNDVKEIIEGAIGEVYGGKLNTSRGHLALDKEEGLDIKIKPKKKSKTSRTFEGMIKDERPLGMTNEQSRVRSFDIEELVEGYTDELLEDEEIPVKKTTSKKKNISKKKPIKKVNKDE